MRNSAMAGRFVVSGLRARTVITLTTHRARSSVSHLLGVAFRTPLRSAPRTEVLARRPRETLLTRAVPATVLAGVCPASHRTRKTGSTVACHPAGDHTFPRPPALSRDPPHAPSSCLPAALLSHKPHQSTPTSPPLCQRPHIHSAWPVRCCHGPPPHSIFSRVYHSCTRTISDSPPPVSPHCSSWPLSSAISSILHLSSPTPARGLTLHHTAEVAGPGPKVQ